MKRGITLKKIMRRQFTLRKIMRRQFTLRKIMKPIFQVPIFFWINHKMKSELLKNLLALHKIRRKLMLLTLRCCLSWEKDVHPINNTVTYRSNLSQLGVGGNDVLKNMLLTLMEYKFYLRDTTSPWKLESPETASQQEHTPPPQWGDFNEGRHREDCQIPSLPPPWPLRGLMWWGREYGPTPH